MAYTVELKPSAAKALEALPKPDQRRIAARIDALATDPRPGGAKKLEGEDDLYRIRVGDYRIVYQIQARRLIVLVVCIAHRRDVYR